MKTRKLFSSESLTLELKESKTGAEFVAIKCVDRLQFLA